MLKQEKPRTDVYASGYGQTPTEFRNKALREENDRAASMEAVMSHNMIQALLGRGATKESVLMQQASEMDKLITEERKKPLVGKLAFNIGEGEDTRLVGFDMRGELEEAQDFALRTVVEAEMAPTLDLVRNAQVTLSDGTVQSWQEFTSPAIARQMPEQEAA